MPTISPRDRESKISVGKDERRKEGRKGLSKLFT